jgi:hypothetical protein
MAVEGGFLAMSSWASHLTCQPLCCLLHCGRDLTGSCRLFALNIASCARSEYFISLIFEKNPHPVGLTGVLRI